LGVAQEKLFGLITLTNRKVQQKLVLEI